MTRCAEQRPVPLELVPKKSQPTNGVVGVYDSVQGSENASEDQGTTALNPRIRPSVAIKSEADLQVLNKHFIE